MGYILLKPFIRYCGTIAPGSYHTLVLRKCVLQNTNKQKCVLLDWFLFLLTGVAVSVGLVCPATLFLLWSSDMLWSCFHLWKRNHATICWEAFPGPEQSDWQHIPAHICKHCPMSPGEFLQVVCNLCWEMLTNSNTGQQFASSCKIIMVNNHGCVSYLWGSLKWAENPWDGLDSQLFLCRPSYLRKALLCVMSFIYFKIYSWNIVDWQC